MFSRDKFPWKKINIFKKKIPNYILKKILIFFRQENSSLERPLLASDIARDSWNHHGKNGRAAALLGKREGAAATTEHPAATWRAQAWPDPPPFFFSFVFFVWILSVLHVAPPPSHILGHNYAQFRGPLFIVFFKPQRNSSLEETSSMIFIFFF